MPSVLLRVSLCRMSLRRFRRVSADGKKALFKLSGHLVDVSGVLVVVVVRHLPGVVRDQGPMLLNFLRP
jgi:hypothetical protein